MKLLIVLIVVAYTKAQLVDPYFGYIPWVQPSNAITLKNADASDPQATSDKSTETSVETTVPLLYNYPHLPLVYSNPGSHVVSYSPINPVYSYYHGGNLLKTVQPTLKATTEEKENDPLAFLSKPLMYYGSPYNFGNFVPLAYSYGHYSLPTATSVVSSNVEPAVESPKTEEEPKTEVVAARKKRSLDIPIIRAVPAEQEFEYKTNYLDSTMDATPADTTKLKLETKTHKFSVPTVKYVQDKISIAPKTYAYPVLSTYNHVLTRAASPVYYSGFYPVNYAHYGVPLSYTTLVQDPKTQDKPVATTE